MSRLWGWFDWNRGWQSTEIENSAQGILNRRSPEKVKDSSHIPKKERSGRRSSPDSFVQSG